MTGDSAGGSLIASLVIKAITSNLRLPDSLLLIYPLLNLDISYFSPSMLYTLEDTILPCFIYDIMTKAYLQNGESLRNPMVSQVFCPREVLKLFPHTEIVVTRSDPLAFDSDRFADRLINAGASVKITEFPGVIHGAAAFSSSKNISVFTPVMNSILNNLKKLLDN